MTDGGETKLLLYSYGHLICAKIVGLKSELISKNPCSIKKITSYYIGNFLSPPRVCCQRGDNRFSSQVGHSFHLLVLFSYVLVYTLHTKLWCNPQLSLLHCKLISFAFLFSLKYHPILWFDWQWLVSAIQTKHWSTFSKVKVSNKYSNRFSVQFAMAQSCSYLLLVP